MKANDLTTEHLLLSDHGDIFVIERIETGNGYVTVIGWVQGGPPDVLTFLGDAEVELA